jgi:hypothetical protein
MNIEFIKALFDASATLSNVYITADYQLFVSATVATQHAITLGNTTVYAITRAQVAALNIEYIDYTITAGDLLANAELVTVGVQVNDVVKVPKHPRDVQSGLSI